MRAWFAIIGAVVLVAASVVFAARVQQSTAERNFGEAQVGPNMRAEIGDQEGALDGFLITHQSEELQPYFESAHQLAVDIAHARNQQASGCGGSRAPEQPERPILYEVFCDEQLVATHTRPGAAALEAHRIYKDRDLSPAVRVRRRRLQPIQP